MLFKICHRKNKYNIVLKLGSKSSKHIYRFLNSNILNRNQCFSSMPKSNNVETIPYIGNVLGNDEKDVKDDNEIFKYLSKIHVCLESGEIERAIQILKKINQKESQLIDCNILNHFLYSISHQKKLRPLFSSTNLTLKLSKLSAIDFFHTWFKKFKNVKPNISTFSILLQEYIKEDRHIIVKLLIKELKKNGYSLEDLKDSQYIKEEDLTKLLKEYSSIESLMPEIYNIPEDINEISENNNEAIDKYDNYYDNKGIIIDNIQNTNVFGVELLHRTLTSFEEFNNPPENSNKEDIMTLYEKQLKIEELVSESALEKLKHSIEKIEDKSDFMVSMISTEQDMKKYFDIWFSALTNSIQNLQKDTEKNKTHSNEITQEGDEVEYFCSLDASKMAYITIQELLKNFIKALPGNVQTECNGSPSSKVIRGIGYALEEEYMAVIMKKYSKMGSLGQQSVLDQKRAYKLFLSGKLFDLDIRSNQKKILEKSSKDQWLPFWPISVKTRIGSMLLSLLIECASVYEHKNGERYERKAFHFTYYRDKGHNHGMIAFDSIISNILQQDPLMNSFFNASHLPMIVMPRPWLTHYSGGFLTNDKIRKKCMRTKKGSYEQIFYLKKADEQGKLNEILMSLDILSSVPWKINKFLLSTIVKVWNMGIPLADIPPSKEWLNANNPIPQPDEEILKNKGELHKFKKAIKSIEQLHSDSHSMRCDTNYKLMIAKTFLKETIYFPHNLDFRGRAYPIPPLFNHLGNDLCRSLLLFGRPKKLGKRGLFWLKVHLANCYGANKQSLDERVLFVEQNLNNIRASAEFPLNKILNEDISSDSDHMLGDSSWWLSAEDPWQCLSVCNELINALNHPISPEEFESALPVHQDGTCNGLQHYAALGGDLSGAKAVNLLPSDRPQDVYSGVLKLVNEKIENDTQAGVKTAKMLNGLLTRKVVKQTVMTYVYGVTFIGAKDQVLKQIKEIKELNKISQSQDLDPLQFFSSIAKYITQLIFSSLGEMFYNAQLIQKWLNSAANLISSSIPLELLQSNTKAPRSSTSVVWTTPLGLTITQPYREFKTMMVNTKLQKFKIESIDHRTPVSSRKQSSAFPPNFIHSLDAAHMMLTSTKMQLSNEKLFFSSVHDSYWTHAADIDTMGKFTREAFIELHSKPILENLLEEFKSRYKGFYVSSNKVVDADKKQMIKGYVPLEFVALPSKGELDINLVMESKYFFH